MSVMMVMMPEVTAEIAKGEWRKDRWAIPICGRIEARRITAMAAMMVPMPVMMPTPMADLLELPCFSGGVRHHRLASNWQRLRRTQLEYARQGSAGA